MAIFSQSFYSNIENLFFRVRPEKTGYDRYECRGMMEYWNGGIMGLKG